MTPDVETIHAHEVRRALLGACRLCKNMPDSVGLTECAVCHKEACAACTCNPLMTNSWTFCRWRCDECLQQPKAGTA